MSIDAFIKKDLSKSGLVESDFDLSPNGGPAITQVTDVVPAKGTLGVSVTGYGIAYPTPAHDGYIAGFIVKRYENHPDHKYQGPTGMQHAYWATDATTFIKSPVKFLVEGEKKALAVAKYLGVAALGMRGCWGAFSEGKLLPEIAENIRIGDVIHVLMDGDFMTHPNIRQAAGTLARQIHERGAEPVMIVFPDYPNGQRMGADDWIMSQPSKARADLRKAFDELPQHEWRELPESPQFAARRLRLMTEGDPLQGKIPKILRNEENTATILKDQFGEGALFTDQYRGPMFAPWGRPPKPYTDDTLDSEIYRYLERSFGTWSKDAFRSCRRALVGYTRRNLLGERLESIVWDGVKRVDTMLQVMFKVKGSHYVTKVSRGYLLGAVARLLDPGFKWDHVLVLEGKQRTGKTYGLDLLHYGYIANVKMEGSKDNLSRQCSSVWLACCDELDHMGKVGREAFKTWVSERVEQWVPKYIEYAKDTPRAFVIAGTTNESTYLNDPTGADRFWPVLVRDKVDHEAIIKWRDQIWAEAIHMYKELKAAGIPWWEEFENDKTGAQSHQRDREQDDVLAGVIEAAMRVHKLPRMHGGREFVTMHWLNEIAQGANLPPLKKTQPMVLDACKRLNLFRVRVRGGKVDTASLAVPCKDGSNITVGNDQFPHGHIPDRLRVYVVRMDGEHFEEDEE